MKTKKLPPAKKTLTQSWFKMKAYLIFLLCVLSSNIAFTQIINPNLYPIVPLDSLPLNRTATNLSVPDLTNLSLAPAYKGFKWDAVDMGHTSWYPQGITGMDVDSSKFLAVSWTDDGTQGAWVCFVNITNMEDSIKYSHVLLVDTNYTTFHGLHAGGIVIKGDTLYVADSRSPYSILKFNLNFIKEVPSVDVVHFHNFKYILQVCGKQPLPIYPSSISYDYDQNKLAVCTFNDNGNQNDYQAGWYNPDEYNANSPYYDHFLSKMQGIASMRDPADTTASLLYIATSWESANSELYVYKHQFVPDTVPGQNAQLGNLYFKHTLRAGIQSLYVEEDGLNLWSLTEYSSGRSVFCLKTADLHPDLYPSVPVDSLPLDRIATKMTQSQLAAQNLPLAFAGFKWNDEDNTTNNWLTQGIAGLNVGNSKFLAVSWSDVDDGYKDDRGVVVSFVNVTDMNSITYRHVLLVDSNYATFPGLDAGGLAVVGDIIYVTDSREGHNEILKFKVNNILKVPDLSLSDFYDYSYILSLSGKMKLPIKPSFMSYDYDQGKLVAGTTTNCSGTPLCDSLNQAGWFDLNGTNTNSPYFKNFIGNMQGMASKSDILEQSQTQLWISSCIELLSFPFPSQLYAFNQPFEENTVQGQDFNLGDDYRIYTMAPGLQTLYLEENGQNLWSLTSSPDTRCVFYMRTQDVSPPVYKYSQDSLADKTYCTPAEVELTATTNFINYANFVATYADWINCNKMTHDLVNSSRSVFAWINKGPIISGDAQTIVGINSTNHDICNLYVNTNNELTMWDGSNDHSTGITVTDNLWHFVGYTYDNANDSTHVYFDGVLALKYKNSQPITAESCRISIGQEYDNDNLSNFYNGMITEASFWSTVLNAADINLIKNRAIRETNPKYGSLVAYYTMMVDSADGPAIVKDYRLKGHYGEATSNNIQERALHQIPGYNSIDHYTKAWRKDQTTVISTAETLSFTAGATDAGSYQLTLSAGKFVITDEFNLTISGELVVGAISANQVIIYQAIPALLTATSPSVGTTPFYYQWESSWNGSDFTIIPGATSVNYQPGALTATTWYRQLQSAGGPDCSAHTNIITITVVPLNLALTNQTITSGVNECYNASQTITVGGTGTPFLVQSGGSVNLIAGQKISLKTGTSVVTGGYLHGYITSTGEYCNTLIPVAPANPVQLLKESPGIPAISSDNIFDCYPNPNDGRFNLRLSTEPGETPAVVKIYNLMGMEIENKTLYSGKLHEISLDGQVAGIYLVSVMQNGKSGIRKVIVNR